MKIEETFSVNAPIDRAWRFIMNPDQVAPCIPGCGDVEILGENKYRANVKLAVGPIKTNFNVTVEITEQQAPNFAATLTRGEEGGKASMVTANSELRLKPVNGEQTEVNYKSEVSIVGRLGKFGLGIMKKKAKAVGEEFAENFRARLETPG
ncbi:MAG: carbon monoxide dehydrogenase subunit G [Pseudomonadota bacterium]|nr:carbon monoxide dehydrogenase subunit G [Pseudomonadota bacterium]